MDWREEMKSLAEELDDYVEERLKEAEELFNPKGVSILTEPDTKEEVTARTDEEWSARIAENLPAGVTEYLDGA